MRRNGKTTAVLLFSLLFAVVLSFTAFTAIVSAESSDNKPPVDKKEIFKTVKENEKIENISMITDDILQISVEHISDKKPVWDIDEWHYYNFKTQIELGIIIW